MELRQLEYFAAVARHRHFGRAAQEVYVTQSALSQQIARLEGELGVALLSRSAKGVELTPAGAELDLHAKAILGRVAEARAGIDAHRGAVRGVARIGATAHDSAGIPPALVAFHREHPQVQLSLRHGPPGQLTELLGTGTVDVAVLGVDGQVPRLPPGMIVRTISQEPLRLVGAAGGRLAGTNDATFEALRGVPVILPERGTALREIVVRACQSAGFSPLPLFETSDPQTIRSLAVEGLGYSVVPASWVDERDPSLGVVRFTDSTPSYSVALVHAGEVPPVGALLIEHLSAFYSAGPPT